MLRYCHRLPCAALLLVLGCAAEPVTPEDDLPLPPPPPPRTYASRASGQPSRSATPAEPGAAGDEAGPEAGQPVEPGPPPPPAWHVVRDGVIGCVDPAPLRLLRQGGDTTPRLLAEARAAGGCRTTFRLNAWDLVGEEGDLVRLRLMNGPSLTLWFVRADVVAP